LSHLPNRLRLPLYPPDLGYPPLLCPSCIEQVRFEEFEDDGWHVLACGRCGVVVQRDRLLEAVPSPEGGAVGMGGAE
jgi:ribosomal protein S27AE